MGLSSADEEIIPETDLSDVGVTRGRFDSARVRNLLREMNSEQELSRLIESRVDQRMIFGINPYYLALASGGGLRDGAGQVIAPDMPPSRALLALVMPRAGETFDMTGEKDPSSQNRYSPEAIKGKVVHKYDEIVLAHSSLACSAHCRYCYRLDLFNRSTGKGLVNPKELRDYVLHYNKRFSRDECTKSEQRHPISEVLLSGGDPMVLSNRQLHKYLAAAGQAGVDIVRIGTKEIAFRPQRFDENFIETLRIFHARYPDVRVRFTFHFSHPDEFLERRDDGSYIQSGQSRDKFVWLRTVEGAIRALQQLSFVSLDNQTPMIKHVNDETYCLFILHKELQRKGIRPQYTFQCRAIEGHKSFAVPIETAWRIHNASQVGLTGPGRSLFVLSTEAGKLEVVGLVGADTSTVASSLVPSAMASHVRGSLGTGLIVFKVHRSPGAGTSLGQLVIAKSNPDALWISDYEDRIIFDGRSPSSDAAGAHLVAV
jgi:lysine 2,3-aminomutase